MTDGGRAMVSFTPTAIWRGAGHALASPALWVSREFTPSASTVTRASTSSPPATTPHTRPSRTMRSSTAMP